MNRCRRVVLLMLVLGLLATACSVGDNDDEDRGAARGAIVFWTTENLDDHIAVQQEIIDAFTDEAGIKVEMNAVADDEHPDLTATNAASGGLPDVVFHGLEPAAGWAEEGLIDPEAAGAVVEELGPETFSPAALELATVDDQVISVPADGWGTQLVYRTDLFDDAGLEPPDTFEAILTAADALHDPSNGISAITLATDPADRLTQQTFEALALANGCETVDDTGEVSLGSPECAEAIELYAMLVNEYSPGGAQTVDSTSAAYLAGQTAMTISPPFILDEMAGMRDDALPTCPECGDNPAFLAQSSGLVGALSGGGAEPVQYGHVSSFSIGADANVAAAQEFIRYLLTDGYVAWLSMAPEGKLPMRRGTAADPETYVTQWLDLETGVDRKAPLSDAYGDEVVTQLQQSVDSFSRWGFEDGVATQASHLYETMVVPETLNEVLQGGLSPQEAAERLASELE